MRICKKPSVAADMVQCITHTGVSGSLTGQEAGSVRSPSLPLFHSPTLPLSLSPSFPLSLFPCFPLSLSPSLPLSLSRCLLLFLSTCLGRHGKCTHTFKGEVFGDLIPICTGFAYSCNRLSPFLRSLSSM
jgi:hypothetical protein